MKLREKHPKDSEPVPSISLPVNNSFLLIIQHYKEPCPEVYLEAVLDAISAEHKKGCYIGNTDELKISLDLSTFIKTADSPKTHFPFIESWSEKESRRKVKSLQ